MVKVAVAGGTGGLGCTIVEELLRQGKHDVVIISRNVSCNLSVYNSENPLGGSYLTRPTL